MQNHETNAGETGEELEADSFEFETGDEREFEAPAEGMLSEVEEMELAAELLTLSSEAELDQFLGNIFKKVWKGVRKIARPLGGVLKRIAKKALPFLGGALGSLIPIPGVGTALGTAIGGAASKLLEVDLEAMSPEDQEFELARRFVRLASRAATQVVPEEAEMSMNDAALAAVRRASSQLGGSPITLKPLRRTGRWERHGTKIVLLGA